MAAWTREDAQRRRRRRRLVRGLALGAAAIGLPALLNRFVHRRALRLPLPRWGTGDVYRWRHGDVAYQRLGEGTPVVLLHSFGPGHSSLEWREAAERLAIGFEVIAPDLLGWGASQAPRLRYEADLYVALLRDFLAEVARRPAAIVAAGGAAAYAVRVAVDEPDRVLALGLVVPRGVEDGPALAADEAVYRLLRLPVLGTAALNLYTSRSSLATYLRRELYVDGGAVEETLVDEHYRAAHRPGAHAALAAHLGGRLDHDVRDALPGLRIPVWIAWGRRAASPRVETADVWLSRLPSAELDVFEHCATLPHAESPDEFCRKLETFLAGVAV